MLSQSGPGGSVAAAALPTRDEFRLQDDTFRCVLLRRLRLPLPLEPRACRCGGALHPLGDHRTACPTAGVLVRRAGPLERAVARVCREAGARVATNVFLRDLNLGMPLSDRRRLEVVANGLPGFGGVQVAVDATLVSPVRRDGTNQPRADASPGLALREATDHKRRSTYPEFRGARRGAASLSLPSRLGGAGGMRRKPSCTASRGARPSPAPKTSPCAEQLAQSRRRATCTDQLARSTCAKATGAEHCSEHLRRATCTQHLRAAACREQLARSSLEQCSLRRPLS